MFKTFSNFREKTLKIPYAQPKTYNWLAHALCVRMCLLTKVILKRMIFEKSDLKEK